MGLPAQAATPRARVEQRRVGPPSEARAPRARARQPPLLAEAQLVVRAVHAPQVYLLAQAPRAAPLAQDLQDRQVVPLAEDPQDPQTVPLVAAPPVAGRLWAVLRRLRQAGPLAADQAARFAAESAGIPRETHRHARPAARTMTASRRRASARSCRTARAPKLDGVTVCSAHSPASRSSSPPRATASRPRSILARGKPR
jgi:hypothetical protein